MYDLKNLLYAGLIGATVSLPPAAADAAALQVQNLAAKPIAFVYASPVTADLFRDDDQLLGPSQTIAPGETWDLEFPGGRNCFFDLKAVFADLTATYRYGVNLCQDSIWTLGE